MLGDHLTLEGLREDYIFRINNAVKKGVFSRRHIARVTNISVNTICRYEEKQYVELRFLPESERVERKLKSAVSQDFIWKQDFLDYLGWSDSWTRKVAKRYNVKLPDFRSVKKPSRKWQKGKVYENKKSIDTWLDNGVECNAIALTLEMSCDTIWQYKRDKEEGIVENG